MASIDVNFDNILKSATVFSYIGIQIFPNKYNFLCSVGHATQFNLPVSYCMLRQIGTDEPARAKQKKEGFI